MIFKMNSGLMAAAICILSAAQAPAQAHWGGQRFAPMTNFAARERTMPVYRYSGVPANLPRQFQSIRQFQPVNGFGADSSSYGAPWRTTLPAQELEQERAVARAAGANMINGFVPGVASPTGGVVAQQAFNSVQAQNAVNSTEVMQARQASQAVEPQPTRYANNGWDRSEGFDYTLPTRPGFYWTSR